jgi:ADP-heptose:LPS heptosyltransferase
LASTCKQAALELLALCLRGEPWTGELIAGLRREECAPDLFGVVAEGLADRFEPALCDVYAALFCELLGEDPERYRRIRAPRKFRSPDPGHVVVLSRVTLGADVAVTSVMLDAAKRRFPRARILLAGARKAYELFEADPRVEHLGLDYPRGGSIRDRVAIWSRIALPEGAVVIDPDSRVTQLGLIPICPEESYYFFESRSYGAASADPIATLAKRWAAETFDVDANAYIAPEPAPLEAEIAISLGVGENTAKRVADPFERKLLEALAGRSILVDKGYGGEEAARVERAIGGVPNVRVWGGAFAPFASAIARSRLFIGYDSAGQHVAAAAGVPLVTIFKGFPTPRMFQRWSPTGPGPIDVIRIDRPDPVEALDRTLLALRKYGIISA